MASESRDGARGWTDGKPRGLHRTRGSVGWFGQVDSGWAGLPTATALRLIWFPGINLPALVRSQCGLRGWLGRGLFLGLGYGSLSGVRTSPGLLQGRESVTQLATAGGGDQSPSSTFYANFELNLLLWPFPGPPMGHLDNKRTFSQNKCLSAEPGHPGQDADEDGPRGTRARGSTALQKGRFPGRGAGLRDASSL